MANTIVGVYENYTQAQGAYNELLANGFDRTDLQLSPEEESANARQTSLRATGTTTASDDQSFGSGIRNFFRNLFGDNDEYSQHADVYSEAVRRGHYLLTVHADDDTELTQATQVMNRFGAVDIDERAAHWKSRGWSGYDETAPALSDSEIEEEHRYYSTGAATRSGLDDTTRTTDVRTSMSPNDMQRRQTATGGVTEGATIPVVQEELQIGKRAVEHGGVRVFQRVRETPVNESVNLHEERVNVERRPVDRQASEAELSGLQEGSFEIRETSEEAVVGKTARVVEEVVVSKEARERTEDIRDTVRRTDVEVEQLGASGRTGTEMLDNDDEYRRHFQTTYGNSGKFEDYAPAYRYGSSAAADERFRGHPWDEAEEDVHADWESHYGAATPWEKAKNAVRYGWERATR